MKLDKAEILARLDAATVASHYGIAGRWGGRWLRSRSCGRDHHGTAAMDVTAAGDPKHPLARGRGRIPDDAQPAPWPVGAAP